MLQVHRGLWVQALSGWAVWTLSKMRRKNWVMIPKRLQIPPMGLHLLMPLQLQQTVLMPLRQLKQLPLQHLLLKSQFHRTRRKYKS